MRRLALLTAGFLLSASLPASAKMPPFDMEVETRGDEAVVACQIVLVVSVWVAHLESRPEYVGKPARSHDRSRSAVSWRGSRVLMRG